VQRLGVGPLGGGSDYRGSGGAGHPCTFSIGATVNLAHGFTYLSELLGLGGLCLGFWGPRNFVILRDFLWLPTNPNQPIWSGLDGLGPALRWDVASRLKLFSSCLQMAKPLGGA